MRWVSTFYSQSSIERCLWVLRYYPMVAKHKLGSPWNGPCHVVRQASGHTMGIQYAENTPIIFVLVNNLKHCLTPDISVWTP